MSGARQPGAGRVGSVRRRWRRRRERELLLEAELQHHLEERIDRLIEHGATPSAARREAERRFGSIARVRHACRIAQRRGEVEVAWRRIPQQLLHELRFALRTIRDSPGFSLAVIVTVALGVGANTAVYSVTDAVLLRPLPYEEPNRLVEITPAGPDGSHVWLDERAQREWVDALGDEVLWHGRHAVTRTDGAFPTQMTLEAVSTNWLDVLGVQPALGRGFAPDERGADVVLLSHPFWRSELGADAEIVGRTLRLQDRVVTVIGVMPRGFDFPAIMPTDGWMPLGADLRAIGKAVLHLDMVARLPAGTDVSAHVDRVNARVEPIAAPDGADGPVGVAVRALDYFRANRDIRSALWMVTGGVGLLFLIMMANVLNLQLVRGLRRRSELVVRRALGASRARLVRHILAETLVLALAGGAAALMLAEVARQMLVGMLPHEVEFFLVGEILIDHRVFLFAMLASLIAGVGGGLLPAMRLSAAGSRPASPGSARSTADGRRLSSAVVVGEVALAIVILAAAGALALSFARLSHVDVGYDADRLASLTLSLPEEEYPDDASRWTLFEEMRVAAERLPGVEAAVVAPGAGLPPDAGFYISPTPRVLGRDPIPAPELLPYALVPPGYLEVLGVRLHSGRDFLREDFDMNRVIIDVDLARALWPDTTAVGRELQLREGEDCLTVVGVVEDLRLMGPDDRRRPYALLHPLTPGGIPWSVASLVVRTAAPADTVRALREMARGVAPGLPIWKLKTGDQASAEAIDEPRFFLLLMAAFSGLALGLAAVGVFGILAAAVRERRRELGVRAALGATALDLRLAVLRRGLALTGTGMAIGLAAWLALGGRLASLLYGTSPHESRVMAAAAVAVAVTSLLACWIPAVRATRVHPAEVLRTE